MSTTTKTVAYYRMSTLKQEDSIERQRATVQAYAQRHGYVINREYIDEGLAGDLVTQRPALQRLLTDAVAGKVGVILADALDRISRLGIWEAGEAYAPLYRAGVVIDTVATGRLEWDDFSGAIVAALHQQKGKVEVDDLGRRVLGGMLKAAAEGRATGGKPAYGYRRENGQLVIDPERARVVRLIFDLYAEQGLSLGDIRWELFRHGIPSPAGGERWSRPMIRKVIDNRRYTGDGCFGVRGTGKYHRHAPDGAPTKVHVSKRHVTELRSEEKWQVRADSHPAIIDRAIWEKARRRRAEHRHPSSCPAEGKPYLFSGLCVCAACGSRLVGRSFADRGRYYMCGRYGDKGKGSCMGYAVSESKLLRLVTGAIERLLANRENVDAVVRQAEQLADDAEAVAPKDHAKLTRQLASLDRQIAGGMKKLSVLDDDLVPDLQASIRGWKEERKEVEQAIEQAKEAAAARGRLQGLRVRILEVVAEVREALRSEEPSLVRAVLRELTSSIELEFSTRKIGKRNTYHFQGGTLNIRPQEGLDLSCLLTNNSRGSR